MTDDPADLTWTVSPHMSDTSKTEALLRHQVADSASESLNSFGMHHPSEEPISAAHVSV